MKFKYLPILLFLVFPFVLKAQQQPWYTQYILNNYILNPAVAGIENYWDLESSYRKQWVGIDGAPVTLYFTAQGPLHPLSGDALNPTSLSSSVQNSRGKAYWDNYTAPDSHFGVGFTLVQDQTGIINDFNAKLSLAYHLRLGTASTLSLGFSAGIQQFSVNTSKLNFGSQNPSDPSVSSLGSFSTLKPDLNLGLWYYTRNYYLGISAQQIIPESIVISTSTLNLSANSLLPEYFIQGGFRFLASEDINVLPSINLHFSKSLPLNFDFNTKIQYQDRFWLGGSYRHLNGFAVMAGMNLNSLVHLGYSYDFTTSSLFQVNQGTHEIVLGLFLRNLSNELCPRNVW